MTNIGKFIEINDSVGIYQQWWWRQQKFDDLLSVSDRSRMSNDDSYSKDICNDLCANASDGRRWTYINDNDSDNGGGGNDCSCHLWMNVEADLPLGLVTINCKRS